MTVAELIETLAKQPQDAKILVHSDFWSGVEEVWYDSSDRTVTIKGY